MKTLYNEEVETVPARVILCWLSPRVIKVTIREKPLEEIFNGFSNF
jgi:hypothetical protein